MINYRFTVNISYDDFMLVYQSQVKTIVVREFGGKTISLPALKFLKFVDYSGVHGDFLLSLNDKGKFLDLQRK